MVAAILLGTGAPVNARAASAYQDDPKPFVMEVAREARARQRIIGVGWNLAFGAIVGDQPFFYVNSVTMDAAVELRLFVANTFSFDVQLDLGESLVEQAVYEDWSSFHLATYFHMHVDPRTDGYFSAAPYVALHVYLGEDEHIPAIQIGARAGGEVMNEANTFGMGFYGRPGMRVFQTHDGRTQMTCEVVFEMTWTGYVLRREGEE